jgi:uncharacterized protein (DUF697 family)
MLSKLNLANVWRNVKELDLLHIREDAEKIVRLVIAGAEPEKLQALADNLRSDPRRPDDVSRTLIPLVGLDMQVERGSADLILLVFTEDPDKRERQAAALSEWARAGHQVILILDPGAADPQIATAAIPAGGFPVVFAAPEDWSGLQSELAPVILKILPDDLMALGRRFPMLRETAARRLISDTSTANAAYSFSTGLAEIIPVLDIPLNVADIIILTKAQALLVYKLGLTLGLSPDWQYYLTEFSGVIGSGFLWRQVARSLVGLIPAWGIIPKVAVAYSGTYTVGQAVLHWYLTGRHATRKMLRGFMRDALSRGRSLGQSLRARLPSGKEKAPRLDAGELAPMQASVNARICTHCSTVNDEDARFCKNCGQGLS